MALGIGAGRRSDHADLLVLRDGRLREPRRRDAGVRGRRSGHLQRGSGRVARGLTPRTRAILPVHLYGLCADMDRDPGRRPHAPACPSSRTPRRRSGRVSGTRQAGGFGLAGCFSFFPSKNLGAFGDAGLVTTNDARARQRAAAGAQPRRGAEVLPLAHRRQLPARRAAGRGAAREGAAPGRLDRGPARERRALPRCCSRRPDCRTSWNFRSSRPGTRTSTTSSSFAWPDATRCASTWRRTASAPRSTIRCPSTGRRVSRRSRARPADFPVADRAAASSLALPIYAELSLEQQRHVVDSIAGFCRATDADETAGPDHRARPASWAKRWSRNSSPRHEVVGAQPRGSGRRRRRPVMATVSAHLSRRHRQLRGLHERGRRRTDPSAGARAPTPGPCGRWPGPRRTSTPCSCTSAPTSCSTARSIGPISERRRTESRAAPTRYPSCWANGSPPTRPPTTCCALRACSAVRRPAAVWTGSCRT